MKDPSLTDIICAKLADIMRAARAERDILGKDICNETAYCFERHENYLFYGLIQRSALAISGRMAGIDGADIREIEETVRSYEPDNLTEKNSKEAYQSLLANLLVCITNGSIKDVHAPLLIECPYKIPKLM